MHHSTRALASRISVYSDRLASLSPDEAGLVATELHRRGALPPGLSVDYGRPLPPENLVGVMGGCGLLAADAVVVMLGVPGPQAQNIIEKLINRPITHLPAVQAPPPPPRHEGSRPAAVDRRPGAGGRRIEVLCTNPKRPNSEAAERFDLYRTGMTVGEYIAAGGRQRDITWDAKQGYIRLVDAA